MKMKKLRRLLKGKWKAKEDPDPGEEPEINTWMEQYRTVLPPQIQSVEILGSICDEVKIPLHGYNGRSTLVGGYAYYCFNEVVGNGENSSSTPQNWIGMVVDPDNSPLQCDTFSREVDGVTKEFMPKTEREIVYEMEKGARVWLSLGGICEANEKSGHAHVWFQKWIIIPGDNGGIAEIYRGVGIGSLTVNRETGYPASRRVCKEKMIFTSEDPAFGTFCAAEHESFFYVWGKQGEHVYLARVAKWTPTQGELYEFWNGYEFDPEVKMVAPVFTGYSNGTVFRTKMFGNSYSWGFIGLSERGDRTVDVGMASRISGPYKISTLLCPKMLPSPHQISSDLFLHPWALREEGGQMMITWKDSNTGKITAAKLQLEMLHSGTFLTEISLSKLPDVFSGLAHGRKPMIEAIARTRGIYSEVETVEDGKVLIRLMGGIPAEVSDVTTKVRELLKNWRDELLSDDLNTKLRAKSLLPEKEAIVVDEEKSGSKLKALKTTENF